MEKIIKNGREFYKFRIKDEFEVISGKGSFNKMKKEGLASEKYNLDKGFIYPIYSGSTIGDAINGYSKVYNFEGSAIKVSKDGDAGKTIFVKGKTFNGSGSFYLVSKLSNFYISLYFNKMLPKFRQRTSVPHVYYRDFKNSIVEIPANHKELAKVIKRITEYKQLSKKLIKQLQNYKLSILQTVAKEIEKHKQNRNNDKYISFRIGDEFILNLGWDKRHFGKKVEEYKEIGLLKAVDINLGNFNQMETVGLTSKFKDNDYKYNFYDNSTQNNHVKGYSKIYNYFGKSLKINLRGSVGETKLINGKYFAGQSVLLAFHKYYSNEFIEIYLNRFLPKKSQGSAVMALDKVNIKKEKIEIPINHKELSKIIKQINEWEELINKTTKKLEKYIEGFLRLSLGGITNEQIK